MDLAMGTVAVGVAIFLLRRSLARSIVKFQADAFDRALDEDGVAYWQGAIGLLVAAFGVVFVVLAAR